MFQKYLYLCSRTILINILCGISVQLIWWLQQKLRGSKVGTRTVMCSGVSEGRTGKTQKWWKGSMRENGKASYRNSPFHRRKKESMTTKESHLAGLIHHTQYISFIWLKMFRDTFCDSFPIIWNIHIVTVIIKSSSGPQLFRLCNHYFYT